MARDADLGGFGLGLLVLGLGGLGAAYMFLRSRPSGSPREPVSRRPSGQFLGIDGERVLIFGDSLAHPGADAGPTITDVTVPAAMASSSAPGAVFAARLLEGVDTGGQHAQAVRINARVGRSARSFLLNEDSASLLARDKTFSPTKVIVMLGTNDIDRGTGTTALGQTKDAMRQIRDAYRAMGAEVVAIGPPSYQSDRYTQGAPAMLAAMREVFGADRTLDARPLTVGAGRSGDGVHFTQAGAALAGKQLTRAVTAQGGAVV